MILEIQTGGRSYKEVLDDIYEAGSVYGVTEGWIDKYLNVDNYGDIIEVSVNQWDARDPSGSEEVIQLIADELDMVYYTEIL